MALLLPVYMLLLGLFAVGIGWIVSSLQVYLRDTAQVLNVVMTFGSGSRRFSSVSS